MNNSEAFIFDVEIAEDDAEIRLPFTLDCKSDQGTSFLIYWGDGSEKIQTEPHKLKEWCHTYKKKGTYTVVCNGSLFCLYFLYFWTSRNIPKTTIKQWGNTYVSSHCLSDVNIVFDAVDTPSFPKKDFLSIAGLFNEHRNVELKEDIGKWDVSNVASFCHVFCGFEKQIPNISRWDVSNGSIFSFMFRSTKHPIPDLSKWDVRKGLSFSGMFAHTKNPVVGLENWKVHPDADLTNMFKNCHPDTKIPSWYKRWEEKQKTEVAQ